MIELTSDNLAEVIKENESIIIQYGASWCGACKIVRPKFSALEESSPDVAFYYVDAENFPHSRSLASVNNLPTFAGFKNGKLVAQNAGTNIDKVKEILHEIASH